MAYDGMLFTMKEALRKNTLWFLFILIPLSLSAVSCGSAPVVKEKGRDYVWPLPPETPRIKYVRSIWGEEDLWTSRSTFMTAVIGKKASVDLFKPYGVTVDTNGRMFVTDTIRKLVFVFDEAEARLSFLGRRDNVFRVPVGVATDNGERIYVSDTGHDEVFIFGMPDRMIGRFGSGILDNPSGMAVNTAQGRIYVVSTRSHRVEVFSLEGGHLFGFGGRGKEPGMLNFPTDIALDGRGDLYVLDSGNFRVQVLTGEGDYIREFGKLGAGAGHFSRPKGIAIDSEGNVYVTDGAFNNFQIFDQMGNLLLFIGTAGTFDPGAFSLPADICVDASDRIYVSDQLNKRVQIFQLLK